MKKILLKNATLLDGTERMSPRPETDLLLSDGKIEKIGKNLPSDGAKVIDLSGKFILPGLINLHVHLPSSGKLSKKKVADKGKLVSFITSSKATRKIGVAVCAKYARAELYSGVTTVRAVGGVGNCDSLLRDAINRGKRIGPRILSSNNAIGSPHCHMEGTVSVVAKTPEEAVALVEKQAREGADLIKLMITGGILDATERGNPGVLKMDLAMAKACCEKAHSLGKKVAAHVEGPEGMRVAIESGVDTIEHGALAPDGLLLAFRDRGGALVPTFAAAMSFDKLDPAEIGYTEDAQYNTRVFEAWMAENANRCVELGIPVGLGTDAACPLVTHYDFWRELLYFKSFVRGTTSQNVLFRATLGNARIAGVDSIAGSVEEGKSADLLVVGGNPLEDLRVLRDPFAVFFRGKEYRKKVKKFRDVERLLDSFLPIEAA